MPARIFCEDPTTAAGHSSYNVTDLEASAIVEAQPWEFIPIEQQHGKPVLIPRPRIIKIAYY